jgi:hypothetical protein
MNFKFPFYIKDADPKGTQEALAFLQEFYTRYPTGREVGEALHQLRRELNLIQDIETKKKTVKKLLDDMPEE